VLFIWHNLNNQPKNDIKFKKWYKYIPGTKNWVSCPCAYCTIAPPAVVALLIVSVWSPGTPSPCVAICIVPAGITVK